MSALPIHLHSSASPCCSSVWRYWLVMFPHAGRRKSIPWKRLGTSNEAGAASHFAFRIRRVAGEDSPFVRRIEDAVHRFSAANVEHRAVFTVDEVTDRRAATPDAAFNFERSDFQRDL